MVVAVAAVALRSGKVGGGSSGKVGGRNGGSGSGSGSGEDEGSGVGGDEKSRVRWHKVGLPSATFPPKFDWEDMVKCSP
jgi:hypothetical protein